MKTRRTSETHRHHGLRVRDAGQQARMLQCSSARVTEQSLVAQS